jgi:hypothetical protein
MGDIGSSWDIERTTIASLRGTICRETGYCPREVNSVRLGRVLVVAFLLTAAVWASSPIMAAPLSDPVVLHGRVTDDRGVPLAAVFINVSDSQGHTLGHTLTGQDGTYRLGVAAAEAYKVWAGKTDNYLFRYVPETKEAQHLTADFRLQQGANIIIAAHDDTGRRLANGEFRKINAARVFPTNLEDKPAVGAFEAVHSETSDGQWDKAWPALIVVPGARYKLLVQWEVPQVGKLLWTLDNGGTGYRVDQAGGRMELDLSREIARSSLAALRRAAATENATASIEQSQRHLLAGEAALAASPPDTAGAVRAFSRSVKSSLEAHEQLVLARATADIERNRKGDVSVTVVNNIGVPLSDVSVAFQQTASDFKFGSHPLGRNGSYDSRLAAKMREAGINESNVTARWGRLETRDGVFEWDNIDRYQRPQDQKKAGFGLLGGLSLWFSHNEDFSPRYLQSVHFSGLRDAVSRYGHTLARRYAGTIDTWELNELNLEGANVFNLDWNQRIEIGHVFAGAIKAGNPNARIMTGSLALPYDSPRSRSLPDLLLGGLPADIVGLELYQAGVNKEGAGVVGLDLVKIDRLLDQYAAFGKPIVVKEFSVPSAQVEGSSWWHRPWDESLQAEFATKVYTIAFAKRLMGGITWAWGVSDADAFILHGGLVDDQMRPKAAYFALQRLLASWRTHGTNKTDATGTAAWRGFAGTYQVTLTRDGHEMLRTSIQVTEQQYSQFVIRVSPE